MLVVAFATTAEEHGRLDSCAADLHLRSIGILHMRSRERPALVQRTITLAITQNWSIFDVDLLIDIELALLFQERTLGLQQRGLAFKDLKCLLKTRNFVITSGFPVSVCLRLCDA